MATAPTASTINDPRHWRDCATFGPIGARQQAVGLGGVGVCFLAIAVMALDCGCGALGAKMTPS